ncbi:nucleotidyltransferase family protein [Persicobacter sp. CCB-QB2]|uniref:nucleotidyltransferase family protein n=1 Tax=Persicobacter sp. CCB-QB2 TaxID=1561025 RepID=UPI0006A9A05E|nr:nucleotidyltransferase domain-containing protein [Persicobacter sp. CCB-QB2]
MEVRDLDLSAKDLGILQSILNQYFPDAQAWAYGSRVTGKARPGSDLDVVVLVPCASPAFYEMREALAESDISVRVDLFVWGEIPGQFQEQIKEAFFILQ